MWTPIDKARSSGASTGGTEHNDGDRARGASRRSNAATVASRIGNFGNGRLVGEFLIVRQPNGSSTNPSDSTIMPLGINSNGSNAEVYIDVTHLPGQEELFSTTTGYTNAESPASQGGGGMTSSTSSHRRQRRSAG